MKSIFQNIGLVLLLCFLSQTIFAQKTIKEINWMTWSEAIKANEQNAKPFFIDIYTDWCGYCKRMDKSTFTNRQVIDYINKNYHPVKLNAEQKESISWRGVTFIYQKGKKRGYHTLASSLLENNMTYPSFVYLTQKLERIMISPGYKDSNMLLNELKFAAEGYYDKMTWDKYKERAPQMEKTKVQQGKVIRQK